MRGSLNCRFAALVVANPDRLLDAADEDLSVTDAAGAGGAENGLHDLISQGVVDDDFQLDLGKKIDGVFAAAIELGVALLAAVSASFQNGDSLDARFDQGFLDCIQLGGLD